jgi:glutamyl-tRNA synthetase
VPDYVIVRSNGEPLYTLVNPLDDSLMKITHVLRGEDLLPSTPRQIVLYDALEQIGVGSGRTPAFGHLPTVLGEGSRRLSKRDQGSGLAEYRKRGYLPEGLLNYLALLGWGIAEDRDVFSIAEMVEAFDIRRVNASPARFDAKKCEAINAAHIRMLAPAELTEHLVPFLAAAGLISQPPLPIERDRLAAATPLIQERINTLSEAVGLLAFLFLPDDKIIIAPDAGLSADSIPTLTAAHEALAALQAFDHTAVESALRTALIDNLGLKPRLAFGPVRAAVTGSRISPPLFESIELLGRQSTLARIAAALAEVGEPAFVGSSHTSGTAPTSTPDPVRP